MIHKNPEGKPRAGGLVSWAWEGHYGPGESAAATDNWKEREERGGGQTRVPTADATQDGEKRLFESEWLGKTTQPQRRETSHRTLKMSWLPSWCGWRKGRELPPEDKPVMVETVVRVETVVMETAVRVEMAVGPMIINQSNKSSFGGGVLTLCNTETKKNQ